VPLPLEDILLHLLNINNRHHRNNSWRLLLLPQNHISSRRGDRGGIDLLLDNDWEISCSCLLLLHLRQTIEVLTRHIY